MRVELRAPEGHGELGVPVRVEPPHGPEVAAAIDLLEVLDGLLGGLTRRATDRGGGVQASEEVKGRWVWAGQAATDPSGQVVDVG